MPDDPQYAMFDDMVFYSWQCAFNNRSLMCPAPWRLPTKEDLEKLAADPYFTALHTMWGANGNYVEHSVSNVSYTTHLWSADEQNSLHAYSFYCPIGSAPSVQPATKYTGEEVRCVKSE
jgi:hypothetical protein